MSQEATPWKSGLPDDIDDDYDLAVVHLAWDRHVETRELTLLFGFVEFLPREVPPPLDDYDAKSPESAHRLGTRSKHWLYVRHLVMPAKAALAWYLECSEGNGALPARDGPPGTKLKLSSLSGTPPWPSLVSIDDEERTAPFCPGWISDPRAHHLIPAVFDVETLWPNSAERRNARAWLRDKLHFDLDEVPAYWGSLHLIAPNPVYRSLSVRLCDMVPNDESVVLQFQPRAGKTVQGLQLILIEEEPWGTTAFLHMTVESPNVRAIFGRDVSSVSTAVVSERYGVLQRSREAHSFVSSIGLNINMGTRTVVEAGKNSYEVTRYGPPEESFVGKPKDVSPARRRLIESHYARKAARHSKANRQWWFRGQIEEARGVLRGLLHGGQREVLLVDPYIAAQEVVDFCLAVGRTDIPVHILTSAMHLKDTASASRGNVEYGEQLLAMMNELKSRPRMNPFEVRVMKGKKSVVHDRVLSVDDAIWSIGSSLNELGARGTMIVALPDPGAIRAELRQVWTESKPLDEWLADHRKSKSARSVRCEITGSLSRMRMRVTTRLRRAILRLFENKPGAS